MESSDGDKNTKLENALNGAMLIAQLDDVELFSLADSMARMHVEGCLGEKKTLEAFSTLSELFPSRWRKY